MLEVHCSGTPYEIGLQHGQKAKIEISRCIAFYADLFVTTATMKWDKVQATAMEFEPIIKKKWPNYLQEMSGVAEGAGVELADVLAINVRTEITFGLFSDGCTSMAWKTGESSFLSQNWDWMPEQKQNLIILHISQAGKPDIKMVTEAGLIGKIGINSSSVGVCLNAIRAQGVDLTRLPTHLGLRMVLESESREDAVRKLERYGVASSCHMLIGDRSGSVGLECSSLDFKKLDMDSAGRVCHANHYLVDHPGVEDTVWLKDSLFRTERIKELCKLYSPEAPTFEGIKGLYRDEMNFPVSINRLYSEGASTSETLFNIVMELKERKAEITLGRPSSPEDFVALTF